MSVQYKSSDGWKNISSSSNNAVDTVENGNMNPVTSNAVYDALNNTVKHYMPIVNSYFASGAQASSAGSMTSTGISGEGIVFQNIFGGRYLHFTCTDIPNTPVAAQIGYGTDNLTLPTAETTGAERQGFKNLSNLPAGDYVMDLNGVPVWPRFYISATTAITFSNVYRSNDKGTATEIPW